MQCTLYNLDILNYLLILFLKRSNTTSSVEVSVRGSRSRRSRGEMPAASRRAFSISRPMSTSCCCLPRKTGCKQTEDTNDSQRVLASGSSSRSRSRFSFARRSRSSRLAFSVSSILRRRLLLSVRLSLVNSLHAEIDFRDCRQHTQ